MKKLLILIPGTIGLWAGIAFISALFQSGGLVNLMQEYFVAVGAITEYHSMVDFYTHIKGVEYIICMAFFVAFPAFFKYINNTKEKQTVKA